MADYSVLFPCSKWSWLWTGQDTRLRGHLLMKIPWQSLKIIWLHWYHHISSPKLWYVRFHRNSCEKDTPVLQCLFICCCSNTEKYKAHFLPQGHSWEQWGATYRMVSRLRRQKLWDTYNIQADTLQLFYAFDFILRKDNSHHLLWVQKNEESFINS